MVSNMCWGINFYPLPKSFTNTIRIMPIFGVLKFQTLDLSAAGGNEKKMHEVLGIGVKWGKSYEGWGIHYNILRSSVVTASGNDFIKTDLTLDALKWRGYLKLVDDGTSRFAIFGSAGQFFGNYIISTESESSGITQYKQRLVTGVLVDLGVGFSYELNPEWDIFIQALVQSSMNETITNIVGTSSSDPKVDMTGTMIQLGTSLRI